MLGLVLIEVSNDENQNAPDLLLLINVMFGFGVIHNCLGLILRHLFVVIVISLKAFIAVQVAWNACSVLVGLFNTHVCLTWPWDVGRRI
jgi:hypothetical protein